MTQVRLSYGAFVLAVFTAGMSLLAYWSHAGNSTGFPVQHLGSVLLWLGILAVAAFSPVPLPEHGGTVSLAPAFEFSVLLVFGPSAACWIVVLSRLAANAGGRWDSRATLAVGQAALAIGVSGFVYDRLGGVTGEAFAVNMGSGLALAAAGTLHLLLRHGIAAGANALSAPELASNRMGDARTAFGIEALFLPFAVPLAFADCISPGW